MLAGMRWRRVAYRLPLPGVAAAGAVVGHTMAYAVAVPEAGARVALLGATGHTYWWAATAAALVLGVASLVTTLVRHFRAGLLPGQPQPGEPLGRLVARLAGFQIAIYLVQEVLERIEAGVPVQALVEGRLLSVGILLQVAVAVVLALLLSTVGLVAEAAGRALRRLRCHLEPTARPVVAPALVWPSRLLAAGLGSRAPPHCLLTR
jgi:hypothetical protein